jgi:hypothetical protein
MQISISELASPSAAVTLSPLICGNFLFIVYANAHISQHLEAPSYDLLKIILLSNVIHAMLHEIILLTPGINAWCLLCA